MASTINADDGVVSGSAGVKTSADNSGVLELQSNGTTQFTLGSSSVVINEAGADVDFRVEGDTDSNLLFVDASTDRVGVGTNAPQAKLDVRGGALIADATPQIQFTDTDNNADAYIQGTDGNLRFFADDSQEGADSLISWSIDGSEKARLNSAGNLGLGVTPSAWGSGRKAIQIGGVANNYFMGSQNTVFGNNAYNDGTNWKYLTSYFAGLYVQSEGGQHQWYTAPTGTAGNNITFTQAMTLDASGNLLVGRTTASGLAGLQVGTSSSGKSITLHGSVDGNDGLLQFIDKNDASSLQIGGHSTEVYLYGYGSRPMIFFTNGTARARIASGGQFCINTTTTSGILNVNGEVYLFAQPSGAGNSTLKYDSATGKVTYDASSRLVKENIVDSTYGLAEVLQLKSRKYFRKDDQREEIGFVADEVQEVLPEFVPMAPKSVFTGNEEDTELVPSAVNYDKLTSVLVKAIQEQQAMIEDLKAKVAALESK